MPSYTELGVIAILSFVAVFSGGKYYLNVMEARAALDRLDNNALSVTQQYGSAEVCRDYKNQLTFTGKLACWGR